MEVLKVGTKNVVKCGNCGSELRYNDSDLFLVHHPITPGPHDMDYYDTENHYRLACTCPICRKQVLVHPDAWKVRAMLEAQKRAENY